MPRSRGHTPHVTTRHVKGTSAPNTVLVTRTEATRSPVTNHLWGRGRTQPAQRRVRIDALISRGYRGTGHTSLCGAHRPQHDPHCMATPSPLPLMDCAPQQTWDFTPRGLSGVSSTLTGSRNLPVHPEESQHPSALCWCSLTFALSTGLGGGCHPRTTHRPPAPTESLFSLLGAGPIHAPARR